MITAFYAGLLGLWLTFLYFSVVRYRWKFRVGLGDGGKQELLHAIRIHGNFVETMPYALLLMILIETLQPIGWFLHLCGILLVISRLLHYIGLRASSGASKGRMAAGVITITVIVMCSILLLRTVIIGGAFG